MIPPRGFKAGYFRSAFTRTKGSPLPSHPPPHWLPHESVLGCYLWLCSSNIRSAAKLGRPRLVPVFNPFPRFAHLRNIVENRQTPVQCRCGSSHYSEATDGSDGVGFSSKLVFARIDNGNGVVSSVRLDDRVDYFLACMHV